MIRLSIGHSCPSGYDNNREIMFKFFKVKSLFSTCFYSVNRFTGIWSFYTQIFPHEKSECYSLNHVHIFVTPWTIAWQAALSMEFCSQEYWSGLPLPSPSNLPNPGIKPRSPTLQADSLLTEPPGKPIFQHTPP